ncbi:MAG: HAD hydrolase family protein [Cyclobacteriaceae bacterium]|nr:HAD hydrolase family protein [Cyclobacteriaceae bacterium]MCB0500973.1 HAD hydrolase family protein [Cyclobacteriaceae bacterium]MCB9236671.1 HAD hydrolase family protein [Flammeovirgaceae bacterium]MCO5272592.1 HAD hydrolase family protein [Cyclobacteriaceae bacterium]MCW5901949.1 HAD hydrolase family protein [Cyclobacteriaceae bacterium]
MPAREVLNKYTKTLIRKATAIKAIFFDVDGVLTDGKIIYDGEGRESKHFNVKDGQIIGHLKKAGIIVGAISGRDSAAVAKRCAELKLDFCHQGILDKGEVFKKLAGFHKLKKKEVAYIGDDINDLAAFRLSGLPVCPADAPVYIRKMAAVVTKAKGGEGVLREVGDLVLAAKGILSKILKHK